MFKKFMFTLSLAMIAVMVIGTVSAGSLVGSVTNIGTQDNSVTTNNNQAYDINNNVDINAHNSVDNSVDESVHENTYAKQSGEDNTQIVNTVNTKQETTVSQDGSDNTQTVITNNGGVVDQSKHSSATSQVTIINPKNDPNYYKLDTGVTTSQVISLYDGTSFVAMNDNDIPTIQKSGDIYRYTIKSSVPVLAYVIDAKEANRAEFDIDVVPVYDRFHHKFDLGNLDKIFVNKFRSPQQQFNVTMPEDGRYALVIDTRVAHTLDGRTAKVSDSSVDITYSIEKVESGSPIVDNHIVIGTTDIFPTKENGKIDNTDPNIVRDIKLS
jgi:hypothetical protein